MFCGSLSALAERLAVLYEEKKSLDQPQQTRTPVRHLSRDLLGSVLGPGIIRAGCFPLLKGDSRARGSEGVVWRVRCALHGVAKSAYQPC